MYDFPVISADSNITEPPGTYIDHIDPAWRDRAPKMVDAGEAGDMFVVDGMDRLREGARVQTGARR